MAMMTIGTAVPSADRSLPLSPLALLVLDAATAALAWVGVYTLGVHAVPAELAAATGSLTRACLLNLPGVVAVWIITLNALGLYRPQPCAGVALVTVKVTAGAMITGGVLFVMGAASDVSPSRIVVIAATLLTAAGISVLHTRFRPQPPTSRATVAAPMRLRTARAWPTLCAVAVFIFNLVWYGWYLSFPLLGEDAAANYSFLIETIASAPAFTTRFPIKWLEGLGQPNVFVTVTFDPFSWIMLSGLPAADAFRLSYALRASAAWFTSYLFVRELFGGAGGIAATAATVAMLLAFTLSHPWGIPTFAGMFTATHMALFPLLLWLYLRTTRQRPLLGWGDVALAVGIVVFLVSHPVSSLLGLVALLVFAVAVLITRRGKADHGARRGLVKLIIVNAVVLLAPVFGVYHAWSAVAAVSARNVFAGELATYSWDYLPPHLWHDVPAVVRLVVLLSLLPLLLVRRRTSPVATVGLALLIIVLGVQLAGTIRSFGIARDVFHLLPRPFYLEFYTPVLYGVCAAYALHRTGWLGPSAVARRFRTVRIAVAGAAAWLLLTPWAALAVASAGFGWIPGWSPRRNPRWPAAVGVIGLVVASVATWQLRPERIHEIFGTTALCQDRHLLCRDQPGRTVGAAATPLTEFLRNEVGKGDDVFHGRAEFLLRAPLRLESFSLGADAVRGPQDVEKLRAWVVRARSRSGHVQQDAVAEGVEGLVHDFHRLASEGLPDDIVADIAAWLVEHPDRVQGAWVRTDWQYRDEVTIMVQERNRNVLATGNGMLLRALPFQGVPVASSYEQALDYLYYLLWTRYVNEGVTARHSFNFTSLLTMRPERLALIGVRYVVARDVPLQPTPALTRVFGWQGYSIYEVPGVNTAGYGPRRVTRAETVADEVRLMRRAGFDPQDEAVVGVAEAARVGLGERLEPLATSAVRLEGQTLVFEGRSARARTLAVLPFKFSHCWRPEWEGRPGQVVRADVALLGVVFEEATRVRITWTAGYGSGADCLKADRWLVPQAVAAAQHMR